MPYSTLTPPAPQNALEADGRLICWRCRYNLDEDLYCDCCGATGPGWIIVACDAMLTPSEVGFVGDCCRKG